MSYSDRIKCKSCENGSGPNGCTDCLNTGLDHQAFAGGMEQALNDAYAEGRKDEAEERGNIPGLREAFEAYILRRCNNDKQATARDRVGDYVAHGVHCAWEAVQTFADPDRVPLPPKALELLVQAMEFGNELWHGSVNKEDREGMGFNLKFGIKEYLQEVGYLMKT